VISFGIDVQNKPPDNARKIRAARRRAQTEPAVLDAKRRNYSVDLCEIGLYHVETTELKKSNLKLIEAIAEITNVSPG